MLNNDSAGCWVNGSVGKIVDIVAGKKEAIIKVELHDGDTVDVTPYSWDIFRFYATVADFSRKPSVVSLSIL